VPSDRRGFRHSLPYRTFSLDNAWNPRLCYLKSRGACDAWTQASCRTTLGGGAPSTPHTDPCPQDAPTPQLPGTGDPPAGRGPHSTRRGPPPWDNAHHGPALAPSQNAYKTPRGRAPLGPLGPSSGARSSRWPVSHRRRQHALSATGRRANWPMRPANAALLRPSPRAMSGVF
jgi:hypothetical protein